MRTIALAGKEVTVRPELIDYLPVVALNGLYNNARIISDNNESALERTWHQPSTPETFGKQLRAERRLPRLVDHSMRVSEQLDPLYSTFADLLWNVPPHIEKYFGWDAARQYKRVVLDVQTQFALLHWQLDDQVAEMRRALEHVRGE